MKFKFSKNLDYQLDAIDAVVGIFDTGKNIAKKESGFVLQNARAIIANELEVDSDRVLRNVRALQEQNKIEPKVDKIESLDFSVEMETGTGKTYVYLRTVLELNNKYGLKKFIILVPSVAIREGVLKTIEQTKDHFREIYNTNFGYFAYDSDKLSQVRDYIQSNDIQIMIMTVQSFRTDTNILRTSPDRFNGEKPINLIAEIRPVVIMDEPQNMEADQTREAIELLKPLFKLRYSATHREIHNLVYKLTPVEAYRRGLVKKISVFGVKEDNAGVFLFKVKEITTKKGENPKAKVLIEVKKADGTYEQKEVNLQAGKDLYRESKKNDKYEGLLVQDIDANHNRVELSDGKYYELDQADENKEVIFRTQIRETIKAHFDKQKEIGEDVKVLSLFFIDRVDNYIHEDSLLRNIFNEEFEKLQGNYAKFKNVDVKTVHKGYFASKKVKGEIEYKDSTSGSSKEDREAYDLIMKNKEQLLSFVEPVSFIFSHSALKEGWDNPNIFQICTLRETKSLMKKRQEIGRGLRLPVDINGTRITDNPEISVLTVIANSSYEEYAGGLQQEFEEAGYKGQTDIRNAKEKKIKVKTTRYLDSEEFKELWKRISKRTKFSLEVLTDTLVKRAVEEINRLNIKNITVTVEKGQIYFDKEGNLKNIRQASSSGYKISKKANLPNIVYRISKEVGITRGTVYSILSQIENMDLIFDNTEEFIRSIILIIKTELNNLLVNDGLKYIPTGDSWEIKLLFSDFEALPSKTVKSDRSVFDRVVFDSKGEEDFAVSLENSRNVKVYTKLPRGFEVDTPLGKYIPDWAIVWNTDEGDKLYLVRETKFEYNNLDHELTWEENNKIKCAEKHFNTIRVDYKICEAKDLKDLLK
ncbi:MAG: DEAD/DEAH box helicase family protein [Candidatus Paceibacterota bacterium]